MAITYHAGRRIQAVPDEYKVHTFTTTGNSTFAVTGSGDVEYLVVAGGGGGGYHGSGNVGGGGAGGYRTGTGLGVTAQNYTITVGAGGAVLAKGNNSIFDTITSTGGGAGGIINISSATINDGGSGGGAGQNVSGAGGQGNTPSTTPSQGFNGGAGAGSPNYGGNGGGGAGAVGGSNSGTNGRIGGNGGDGLSSSITGTSVIRAGGGAGSSHNSSTEAQPTGGTGGGGNGSKSGTVGSAGTANTGSGGGGGGDGDYAGGAGGSGIVIIRYLTSSSITATGGTITTISEAETKPTNVQVGSRYEETDTRKIYHYEAGDITYETDFSTNTGWTTTNSSKLNIASGALQIVSTAGLASIYYDLTSITGDFLIRYTTSFTTMGSQSLGIHWTGVSDNTSNAQTNHDGLSFMIYDTGNSFQSSTQNGVRPDQSSDQGALTNSPNPTTGTNYYVELKRDGSNWITSLYNNANYDSVIATKTLSINAGITGLRYFKVMTYTTGADVGQIDDLKFYNGVTTPVMPNVWSEVGT